MKERLTARSSSSNFNFDPEESYCSPETMLYGEGKIGPSVSSFLNKYKTKQNSEHEGKSETHFCGFRVQPLERLKFGEVDWPVP